MNDNLKKIKLCCSCIEPMKDSKFNSCDKCYQYYKAGGKYYKCNRCNKLFDNPSKYGTCYDCYQIIIKGNSNE